MRLSHDFFYLAVGVLAASAFQLRLKHEVKVQPASTDLVALGRRVYISEGCIHCHSQYVRPVGMDQELWGERTSVERALSQEPVLIGNRRQGPDLANVGQRRNAGWNRLHLIEPSAVVPGSRMPSYRHLFESTDTRGEALLAYLNSLQPSEE
jgi:cytochrome c oxidase cbb3-type subunit 2